VEETENLKAKVIEALKYANEISLEECKFTLTGTPVL
jgi:hypothetical protein